VYLGDRTSGKLTQLASAATIAPGQVNGNYAVWEQCQESNGECNVYRHDIAAKTTTRISNTFRSSRFQYAPSVTTTGTVYFVHSGHGCGTSATLVRQPLGGSDTVLVTFKDGIDVGSTYVDDTSGTPTVYCSQSICANHSKHGDVYKITD
jgi:Tol biopolymer transport system component